MAGAVVQFKQLAQNTNTTPASITLDTPATAGNTIVVIYGGDDYVASGSKPSGFTEPTGARQETFLGHYAWYKAAAGGETTFSATPGSAVPWCMIALELSGVGALDVSNGQLTASSATNYSTPTLTPSAGNRFAVATIGGSANVAFPGGVGSWTNSFVEVADVATTLASGTRDNISAATLSFVASGGTIDTNATWDSGFTPQSRTSILLVFAESGAAPAVYPRTIVVAPSAAVQHAATH